MTNRESNIVEQSSRNAVYINYYLPYRKTSIILAPMQFNVATVFFVFFAMSLIFSSKI